MAPDTWDPASRQASIEAGGTSPYISILDDKTQVWILKQGKVWEGQLWFSVRLKRRRKRGGSHGQPRCNACVLLDKGDKRNGPDLGLIKPVEKAD